MKDAPLICSIYKSAKKDEAYLFVKKQDRLSLVAELIPEKLLSIFGEPIHVMDVLLKEEKPLARADVKEVIIALRNKGFYLQMPPPKDDYLLDLMNPEAGL